MAKDRVEQDELDNDLDSFKPVPDENHQFDKEDYDQADTDKKVDELTKLINRMKSNKCESLFDGVPMPKAKPVVRNPDHYRENPNNFYDAKGRLWND